MTLQSKTARAATYGTSLLKAVDILEFLGDREVPQGVSDIARGTGLNKGTVFKLLETLQAVRFVEKTAESQYRMGVGLVRLAHAALGQMDLMTVARPHLMKLNDETGETVHLGVADGHRVVYIAKLESRQAVRMYSSIGKSAPMHCTGIGKALLSGYAEADLDKYLRVVERTVFTPQTISSDQALMAEVRRIRENGYAVDNGEHEEDVRCLAMPLTLGSVLYGAVSVSAPKYRFGEETLEQFMPLLKACQMNILASLG